MNARPRFLRKVKSHPRTPICGIGSRLALAFATVAVTVTGLAPGIAAAHPGHIFRSSFGSPGSGAGQLSLRPRRYVTEKQVTHPGSGLAVNNETGDVYVADTGNHRVDEFDSEGNFIRAFGWGVKDGSPELQSCTSGSGCQAGLSGSQAGELEEPTYIAIDNSGGPSGGDVYVTDFADATVTKFGPAGELISSWDDGGQFHETAVLATGEGEVVAAGASGAGDLKAGRGSGTLTVGSNTVENVDANSEEPFEVGMELFPTQGIPAGTTITAVGPGTLTLSNPASESTEKEFFQAGSKTVENIETTTGTFAVGQVVRAEGIQADSYITAVGPGTITLSQPASSTHVHRALTTEASLVRNLSTATGAFEALQTISGPGIPANTKIQKVASGMLFLTREVAPGSGIQLSARFVVAELGGLAADTSGNLWVGYLAQGGGGELLKLAPGGGFLASRPSNGAGGLAIDSFGDLYLADFSIGTLKLDPSGVAIGYIEQGPTHSEEITGIAIDPTDNGLFVDHSHGAGGSGVPGVEIDQYPASCDPAADSCEPAQAFAAAEESEAAARLSSGQGLAVGPGHLVYAADASRDEILSYRPVSLPDVSTGGVGDLQQTTATLEGEINPDGVELSECTFEYGETSSYGHTVPCAESPAQIGSGHAPVAVHADISSLASTSYHYRLLASNTEAPTHLVQGNDHQFGASIDSGTVESAAANAATLLAQVDPNGIDTTCEVQYLTEAAFEASGFEGAATVPCEPEDLGSRNATQLTCEPFEEADGCVPDLTTTATLAGLTPNTAYRFRFLATQAAHTTAGPAIALYTLAGSAASVCPNQTLRQENTSLALPDCRAYEKVSRNDGSAAYYMSLAGLNPFSVLMSSGPMQVSAAGNAATYVAEDDRSGEGLGSGDQGNSRGDQQFSRRSSNGWEAADIRPLGSGLRPTAYEAFLPDLSQGVIFGAGGEPPLAPGIETGCGLPYLRDSASGEFVPLFTSESKPCQRPHAVGASADGSHQLFESAAARPEAEPGGAKVAPGKGHENIYDFFGGALHLVNVLPGAQHKAVPDATIGSLAPGEATVSVTPEADVVAADTANAVSADGSRVFWTDLANGIVYARLNDVAEPSAESSGHCTEPELACTIQVSAGPATYQAATRDGRYAYYTENGELWSFDTETDSREALAGPGSEVLGLIGLNQTGEDGAYLYFVAKGVLAGNTVENGNGGEAAQAGQPNLYLSHEGDIAFIATLSPFDNEFEACGSCGQNRQGDWLLNLGRRSSQASADGTHLAFLSKRELTGYPNSASSGHCGYNGRAGENTPTAHCPEFYVFSAQTSSLTCASCDPTNTPPKGGRNGEEPWTYPPADFSSITYMRRWISADGSRVFFNTYESLLPSDRNKTLDVYEWEEAGAGTCSGSSPVLGGGCLDLLSAGSADGHQSFFFDASADGNDVFFLTSSQLAAGDNGEGLDLYDARVDGGFRGPGEPRPCEGGESCHGQGTQTTTSSSPATAHFEAPEEGPEHPRCGARRVKRHGRCVASTHHKHKHRKRRRNQRATPDHGAK